MNPDLPDPSMAQQGFPPQALVDQWWAEWDTLYPRNMDLARRASIWAADQQLETCCRVIEERRWFAEPGFRLAELRKACRPPEEGIVKKALGILENAPGADHPVITTVLTAEEHSIIRQALESMRPSSNKGLNNMSVLGDK